ncbi:MAG: hypothetical protein AAF570_17835, partial [Bacteroidota bacterium]
ATDGTEAFNFRKYQFVMYRTKSTLKKAALIPAVDKGIFAHCTVKLCDYVPAPGKDSSSYKRAKMKVNAAGQKKYPVEEMEFIWDPIEGTMISATVSFTNRSLTKWAMFEFSEINSQFQSETPPTNAKSVFLESNGELKADYQGTNLMDYR